VARLLTQRDVHSSPKSDDVSLDWGQIYQDTYADLVRFLSSKVWDPERAKDLAQEVFVRALREEPANPRAFLFTVAANLARDEARTQVRRKRHLTLIRGESEGRTALSDPEAELEMSRKRESAHAALSQLSDTDQTVLLLWEAGMNYGDIAEQSGLSVGAIGTTLSRARKRLVRAHASLEGGQNVARN
jgi:RNA polymerase sigma-70 factor (ECF subfamily)